MSTSSHQCSGSVITVFIAILAVASAWMMTAKPAVQATCPAPVKTPPKMTMPTMDDLALDNPLIEEDDNIMPARKCGFCMG